MSTILEDKDAIREMMADYCGFLDAHEMRKVAEQFTEDGEWTSSIGQAKGIDDIERLMLSFVPDKGTGFERKHHVTNFVIKVDGARATLRCSLLVVRENGNEIIPSLAGAYHVQLVRSEAGWRFNHFQLNVDISGDLGLRA